MWFFLRSTVSNSIKDKNFPENDLLRHFLNIMILINNNDKRNVMII